MPDSIAFQLFGKKYLMNAYTVTSAVDWVAPRLVFKDCQVEVFDEVVTNVWLVSYEGVVNQVNAEIAQK